MHTDIDWIDPKKVLPLELKTVLIKHKLYGITFDTPAIGRRWMSYRAKDVTGWYPLEWL